MTKRNLAVLIVVAACVLAGTAVAAADNGDPGVPPMNDTDSADEAYVSDDGSVILASHGGSAAETAGEFGMNVSDGLVFGSFQQPVETNVTGAFSMAANQSQVNASGSLAMPRPETLQSLDLTVDSETSAENSRADMDLQTTVALPEDSQQLAMMFDQFTTAGSATMTGSSFETQGSAEWSAMTGMEAQEHSLDLQATDQGHVLEVSQSYNVSSFAAEQWNTREKAVQTLEGQFMMVAQMVNGSADFTMDSYNFESGDSGGHLDVEYTVELRGIHDFLRQGLLESLAQSGAFGETTTEDLDVQLDDVAIERVAVDVEINQGSGAASWNVSVDGYDQLALAYMDAVARADDSGMLENQSEQFEKQFAAMEAADLSQTGTWDVTVSTTSDGAVQADASMQQRTENWQAYVSERNARDLPAIGTQQFSFDAATEGEQVVMDGSFLVHQEDMLDQTLQSFEQSFQQSSSMTGVEMNPFARLSAAEFVGSQFDVSVNETLVTADGYAEFGNLSALTSLMDEEVAAGSMQQIYVNAEDETPTTYLRMENMVDSDNPDEATLREHEMITEETTIYLPGEWETQSQSVMVGDSGTETSMLLPMADDDSQQSDDGTQTDEDTETTESSSDDSTDEPTDEMTDGETETTADTNEGETESADESPDSTTAGGPGFGIAVSVVALIAVALIGSRRN